MYTLMILVRSILKEKKLLKTLWAELVKKVIYVKNKCLNIDEITFFQTDNNFKSDILNLQVFEYRA